MTSRPSSSSRSSSSEHTAPADAIPSSFVCAVNEPPYLVCAHSSGVREALPERSIAGAARFPTRSSEGFLAYVALPAHAKAPAWLCVLAILNPDDTLIDLLPRVHPRAAPSWSPCGRYLAYVRRLGDIGEHEAVVYRLQDGDEEILRRGYITGIAWDGPDSLVVCMGSEVLQAPWRQGAVRVLHRSPVAAAFRRYGTDDLYQTFEQPSPGPLGSLAFVSTWHMQAKAPREDLMLLRGGTVAESRVSGVRYPRWFGQRLLLTTPRGVAEVDPSDPNSMTIICPIKGLHSAEPCRPAGKSLPSHTTATRP